MVKPGDRIKALSTDATKKCGITDRGSGYVQAVQGTSVSFYFERGLGIGYFEASCDWGVFISNFVEDRSRSDVAVGAGGSLASKRFPEDCYLK